MRELSEKTGFTSKRIYKFVQILNESGLVDNSIQEFEGRERRNRTIAKNQLNLSSTYQAHQSGSATMGVVKVEGLEENGKEGTHLNGDEGDSDGNADVVMDAPEPPLVVNRRKQRGKLKASEDDEEWREPMALDDDERAKTRIKEEDEVDVKKVTPKKPAQVSLNAARRATFLASKIKELLVIELGEMKE